MFSFKKSIYNSYADFLKHLKYYIYNYRVLGIEQIVKKKAVKKIVFFVINLGMWKYDDLFERLMKDKHFDPVIVSFLYPEDSVEYRKWVQKSMKSYFELRGFPFIEIYDFVNEKWFDVNLLEPDIFFYAQPYNTGFKHLHLEAFWKNSLFAYLPYGLDIEDEPVFYNTFYQNVCSKLYYPTDYHKIYEGKMLYNKGKNIVVCGSPVVERIHSSKADYCEMWKNPDSKLKRVIWAPHHTISPTDFLQYSNFLAIAHDMLLLAKEYQDQIQFAFKPHPRLKTKLYDYEGWGKEKTDHYYEQWASLSTTCFVEGDYVDLFASSDAMIHDCSTFTAEYMATGYPVMFMIKDCINYQLNDFGLQCFNLHYKGKTIGDIEFFLNTIVINQRDELKDLRETFAKDVLLSKSGKTFVDMVVDDLKNSYCE